VKKKQVVSSLEDAVANISSYHRNVAETPGLAARLSRHPSWYAVKGAAGEWLFGPSKYVGYRGMDAKGYLASYDRRDGRETEPALAAWFDSVDPSTALGIELRAAFDAFAAKVGKASNANWRVSVVREEKARRTAAGAIGSDILSNRIDFNPEICGGRPRIKGTRIRISDIVAALGTGETIDEILADFPYLEAADIYAALDYAAKAVDHRVLRAA
jgi:uncharacterized protein (DUF433 family)